MASSIRFADTAGRPDDAARAALLAELRPGADRRSAKMKARRQAIEAQKKVEREEARERERMWQRETTPPQVSWEERLEAERSDPEHLCVLLGQWERGLWRRDYMRRDQNDRLVPLETVLANLEEREEKLRMTDDARLTKEEEEVAKMEDIAERKALGLQLQKRLYERLNADYLKMQAFFKGVPYNYYSSEFSPETRNEKKQTERMRRGARLSYINNQLKALFELKAGGYGPFLRQKESILKEWQGESIEKKLPPKKPKRRKKPTTTIRACADTLACWEEDLDRREDDRLRKIYLEERKEDLREGENAYWKEMREIDAKKRDLNRRHQILLDRFKGQPGT